MLKLLLATILVLLCYALYRQLRGRVESSFGQGASYRGNEVDPHQAVEAEFRILDEDDSQEAENG